MEAAKVGRSQRKRGGQALLLDMQDVLAARVNNTYDENVDSSDDDKQESEDTNDVENT